MVNGHKIYVVRRANFEVVYLVYLYYLQICPAKLMICFERFIRLQHTVEALVGDYLGNSEKWSPLELVAYENGLS